MNGALAFVKRTYGGVHRAITRDARGRAMVTETAFSFLAHCYPSGQLMGPMEPGGRLIQGAYAILTDEALSVDDEAAGTAGDDVMIQGRRYRVKALTDRSDNPIPMIRHRSYVANYVRDGEDGA